MSEFQVFLASTILAFAAMFSGLGFGFLVASFIGSDTPNRRGTSMLAGLIMGLVMLIAQVWLAYHGYKE